MNPLKIAVLLSCLTACGRQIVEFQDDANGPGSDSAVRIDASMIDASIVMDAVPTVISTVPVDGAIQVARSVSLTATFSEAMTASTINAQNFIVRQGSTSVTGVVGFDAATHTAMFVPTVALGDTLEYTATITTAVKSAGGHSLATNYVWTFTTGSNVAANPPTVIFTDPGKLATNVSISKQPTATFSEAMNPATLTALTFTVAEGPLLTPVLGTVTYDATTNTAKFSPTSPLALGTMYTARITTGATDTNADPLAATYQWTFTTAACSQSVAVLGAASTFAVLGASTVTNAGLTALTGDLGVSPGTAITGFPPGTLVGTEHAGDAIAATAHANLGTGFTEVSTRSLCSIGIAGDLGGTTITPGLYKSPISLMLTGAVTLDAQGDADAVFIIVMGSTLTVANGGQVILANGANAANIFWVVDTSATLGTTSMFAGTIMAADSITLETGASLTGRALAVNAAVTLADNAIVRPN